jgi:adenine-specific DNA-methyltransferase
MRNELDVLLDKIADPVLRRDILLQVARLRAKRTFGLVFESHLPERVRLPEHPLRAGISVVYKDAPDSPIFEILAINKNIATFRKIRHSDGSSLSTAQAAKIADDKSKIDNLVAISDFEDNVFPGLRQLASVERGGDKPSHVVIKGENHHVLEALQFTHAGKIDCIYIDPPYNSGAGHWKYDNNYVDDSDFYRHSKWLAFMERRLLLAQQLLNPQDSVLIVTIDEKEYLRLGLLLEQVFKTAKIQMVSININPAAASRAGAFGRSDEYIFFVMQGCSPTRLLLDRDWVSFKGRTHTGAPRWDLLRRSGSGASRADSPGCFYPIYVDAEIPAIVKVGELLPVGDSLPPKVDGALSVLPIRKDGSEGRWMMTPEELRSRIPQGRVRLSVTKNNKKVVIYYLADGEYKKIKAGEYNVERFASDGSMVFAQPDSENVGNVLAVPSTQWRIPSHDSTQYGTRLLSDFIPGRKFPFPKSLYAVEDTIRFFVKKKPNAVVLDFFGGSGTTVHAVARLNRQDGGSRQSILVTNNEVSPAEAEALRKRGLQPGDAKWEALGIFEHITRPRVTAAFTGRTPKGKQIKGEYKFTDGFPMANGFEENVKFFELTYLDAEAVELDVAFCGIAPLLWLRSGGRGPIIDKSLDHSDRRRQYVWTENYGVLFNPDRWRSFVDKRPASASTAFIVTDSQTTFAGIVSELPGGLEVVRLYENYLTTFAINGSFV